MLKRICSYTTIKQVLGVVLLMFTNFGIFPVIGINSIKTGNAVVEVLFRYILWRKKSYKKLLDSSWVCSTSFFFFLPWDLSEGQAHRSYSFFLHNHLVPLCIEAAHPLVCLCTLISSSQVSLPCRNLDYFPSCTCKPTINTLCWKAAKHLDCPPSPWPPCLLPSPACIPSLQSDTSLEPLPLVHQHPLASSPSVPSPASFLSVQVKLSERIGVCRIQSTDWWRWQAKVFKITSNPIKKK